MTTFFLVVAAVGFGLLLLGVLVDDLLEFMDVDSGVLSAPVIGAFLGAFGIGGWIGTSASGNALVGLVGGGVGGLALGWVALRLSFAFMDMHTDATPSSGDFLGQVGRVVTPIEGGDRGGEILIRVGGSPRKLVARCDTDVDQGAEVIVVEVLSASSVRVMTSTELFQQENQ